jgi:DNA-directed RNA polymerase specialized sigma24 family protein
MKSKRQAEWEDLTSPRNCPAPSRRNAGLECCVYPAAGERFLLDFWGGAYYLLGASEFQQFRLSQGMYVDESSVRESLARMVRRLTSNSALSDDLMQEAMIHLWLTESRRPGQTRSWYLQSCKYHLLHYLASGRSVDSSKRRSSRTEEEGQEGHEEMLETGDNGNSVVTWVSARDIISMLSPRLSLLERTVLNCFADGLGPRDIGRKLGISHTMVIKHRRKIAGILDRMEQAPVAAPVSTGTTSQRGFWFEREQTKKTRVKTDRILGFDGSKGGIGYGSGRNRMAGRNGSSRVRLG